MAAAIDRAEQVGEDRFVMLEVGVDHRDDRAGRGERAFDHRRRQAAAADAADEADAAVGLGEARDEFGGAVARSVVDEHRFPFDPGQARG